MPLAAGAPARPLYPSSARSVDAVPMESVGNVGTRTPANSYDWSGYAVTGGPFTSVSASWVQPAVTCPVNKAQQAAFWVGLDGFTSTDPTVEQIGTDSDCVKTTKKVTGGPSYYAWYELYPAGLVPLPSADTVTPGDTISASVSGSGISYTVALADAGKWSYSKPVTIPTAALDSSAEWVAEAPSACKAGACKTLPLADFGSVTFSGATADGLAVDATGGVESTVTMVKNAKGTKLKAQPSALAAGGTGFTVTWKGN